LRLGSGESDFKKFLTRGVMTTRVVMRTFPGPTPTRHKILTCRIYAP